MRGTVLLIGVLAALTLPAAAWADTDSTTTTTTSLTDDGEHRLGFGLHASTLGFGGELNFVANPYLVVRVDYSYYNDYSFYTTKDQVNYDAYLRLNNYGAALDWHPWRVTS